MVRFYTKLWTSIVQAWRFDPLGEGAICSQSASYTRSFCTLVCGLGSWWRRFSRWSDSQQLGPGFIDGLLCLPPSCIKDQKLRNVFNRLWGIVAVNKTYNCNYSVIQLCLPQDSLIEVVLTSCARLFYRSWHSGFWSLEFVSLCNRKCWWIGRFFLRFTQVL